MLGSAMAVSRQHIRAKGRVFMRVHVASVLISMAFVTPAMALTSSPIMDPRQPSICDIGRPTTETRALPGNEMVKPRLDLRAVVIRIVLRVLGCRVAAPRPTPQK
jgi:hypothetical protein